jgi:hypothetical protein
MTVNLLFPVFYMKRAAEGQKEIKTDDIISDFKVNSKKVFIAYFGLTFFGNAGCNGYFRILLSVGVFFIGIFLLLFILPNLFSIITFLCYDYFNGNKGFSKA